MRESSLGKKKRILIMERWLQETAKSPPLILEERATAGHGSVQYNLPEEVFS